MLRLFSIFLVFFCFLNVSGQSDKVLSINYEFIIAKKTSINKGELEYRLLVDENTYKYEFIKDNTNTMGFTLPSAVGFNLVSYHIGSVHDNIDFQYTNFPFKKGEDYTVRDSLPPIKWKIQDTLIMLNNYKCTRAEANYRGRVIIAYFTQEIPINIGPAKLNGLPGAILLAHTHDNVFTYKATKIETIPRPEDFYKYEDFEFGDVISLQDYVRLTEDSKRKDLAILKAKYQSQLSNAGASEDVVKSAGVISERSTLELIYEWELKQ